VEVDKGKIKEPGLGRLLLGALALGSAILLGFVLGLRAGDRDRNEVPPVAGIAMPVPDTLALQDTVATAPEPEPAEPAPGFSKQEIALGLEYLASHNRWNREEMEKIAVLAGLWDAVNTYAVDEIRRYNETLVSTSLTAIVDGLERTPKHGFYTSTGDSNITLSTYIKHLR
jgi:hypothetical protein